MVSGDIPVSVRTCVRTGCVWDFCECDDSYKGRLCVILGDMPVSLRTSVKIGFHFRQ